MRSAVPGDFAHPTYDWFHGIRRLEGPGFPGDTIVECHLLTFVMQTPSTQRPARLQLQNVTGIACQSHLFQARDEIPTLVLRRPRRSHSTVLRRRLCGDQISPLGRPNLAPCAARESLLAFSLALIHGSASTENRLPRFTSIFAFAVAVTDLAPLIAQLSKNEQAISFYLFSGFRALKYQGRNQQHRK